MISTVITPALYLFSQIRNKAAGSEKIQKAKKGAQKYSELVNTPNSLTEYTRAGRVEPIILIDESLRHQPIISEVMQTSLSLFSAYYCLAIDLSTQIGGQSIINKIEQFNPNRNGSAYKAARAVYNNFTMESLPEIYNFKDRVSYTVEEFPSDLALGLENTPENQFKRNESEKDRNFRAGQSEIDRDFKNRQDQQKEAWRRQERKQERALDNRIHDNARENSEEIRNASNLAVGKILKITIRHEEIATTIDVIVRLNPLTISPRNLISVLSLGSTRNTVTERWHRFKSGELSFISDILLSRDMVIEHQRLLSEDKSGFYRDTIKRRRENTLKALETGKASIADASSIIVLSKDTAAGIAAQVGGTLDSMSVRESIFQMTASMMIIVVNPEADVIWIYHKGQKNANELHLREMKVLNKGSGPDITEMLKALQAGQGLSL